MHEIRLWRIANSAQWVAWGIVQAQVEIEGDLLGSDDTATQAEKNEEKEKEQEKEKADDAERDEEEEEEGDEEEEFDYLAYAQERAYFFWGDMLQLGLVKKEDLPAELLGKIKIVRY